MKELQDRVAVVTGAASGVGRALVKAFLGEGMKVVLADVEEPALDAAVKELGSLGEVSSFVTDVRRYEALEALADHTYSTFGACRALHPEQSAFAGHTRGCRPNPEHQLEAHHR